MHAFVVFDVFSFLENRNEIIANCYELADVQTMVEGVARGIYLAAYNIKGLS